MSLLKNITDEMYLSMKSGDKEKANALRTLISKLKDPQTDEISSSNLFEILNALKIFFLNSGIFIE